MPDPEMGSFNSHQNHGSLQDETNVEPFDRSSNAIETQSPRNTIADTKFEEYKRKLGIQATDSDEEIGVQDLGEF